MKDDSNVFAPSWIIVVDDEKNTSRIVVGNTNENIKAHRRLFRSSRRCKTMILRIENAVNIPCKRLSVTSGNNMTLLVTFTDIPKEIRSVIEKVEEDLS